jgi:hypothetical protein
MRTHDEIFADLVARKARAIAAQAAAASKARVSAPSPGTSARRAPASIAAPGPSRKLSRREKGNIAAQRLGGPVDQASIDSLWTGIAAQRNASVPSTPIEGRRASPRPAPQGQGDIDDMWTSLATNLNKRAGIARTPVGDRAR